MIDAFETRVVTRPARVSAHCRERHYLNGTALALLLAIGGSGVAWAGSAAPGAQAADAPMARAGAAQTPPSSESPSSPTQSSTPDKAKPSEVREVVVTAAGTNIAGVKPVGSEVVSVSREQMLDTGYTNVADVLNTLPQVQQTGDGGGIAFRQGGTAGYGNGGFGGANSTQGTAINLRGVGTEATLVLVDGHRVAPSGAANTFTEAVQVPVAALERVEVVADGASAIYGSDAIAGVVNYVLRKDYNGAEIAGRYTHDYGYDERGASVVAGHSWSSVAGLGQGGLVISADLDERDPMLEYDSPYLRRDLRPLGGNDNRLIGNAAYAPGVPGNVFAGAPVGPYTIYGLPNGANTNLTFANLSSTPNLTDASKYTDYLPYQRRSQLALFAHQDITDWLNVYYEGFYTHRYSYSRSTPPNASPPNFTVPATSPYYIPGVPGVSASAPETVQYNFFKDIGYASTVNPDITYTQTAGAKFKLPYSWRGEGYFTWGSDRTCGECQIGDNIDTAAFQNDINLGLINPFSATPLAKSIIKTFVGTNIQNSRNVINDAVLKFNGPLFELPGGLVRAAIGGEYTSSDEHLTNGANRGLNDVFGIDNVAYTHRNIGSGFAEFYIPIVDSQNNVPLVKSLNVDAAVRYDHYSDFGGTTNPKIGLTWTVDDDLLFRGSWGTSFRAPYLPDLNPGVFSYHAIFPTVNGSGDPAIKDSFPGYTTVLQIGGGNPNLQPETATTWSVGGDWTPHQVQGLKLSATYYSISYQNEIVFSPPANIFLSSPTYRALYAKYITPINNTGCVEGNNSTYDPKLLPFLAYPALYGPSLAGSICTVQAALDAREANDAATLNDGVDLQASYTFGSPVGRWLLQASLTKILDNSVTSVPGGASQSELDTVFNPVSLHGRGTIGWAKGPYAANLFINYVGSYTNDLPLVVGGVARPSSTVPAWVTLDAGFVYTAPKDRGPFWLRGLRASVNIQNLLDETPPTVLTNLNQAFDPSQANVFGRVAIFQLTKDF